MGDRAGTGGLLVQTGLGALDEDKSVWSAVRADVEKPGSVVFGCRMS